MENAEIDYIVDLKARDSFRAAAAILQDVGQDIALRGAILPGGWLYTGPELDEITTAKLDAVEAYFIPIAPYF